MAFTLAGRLNAGSSFSDRALASDLPLFGSRSLVCKHPLTPLYSCDASISPPLIFLQPVLYRRKKLIPTCAILPGTQAKSRISLNILAQDSTYKIIQTVLDRGVKLTHVSAGLFWSAGGFLQPLPEARQRQDRDVHLCLVSVLPSVGKRMQRKTTHV